MEEEKIIVPMSEVELTTNATLYKQETAISETVDEINVEAIEEMIIDVSETTGVVTGTHVVSAHTHEIDDVTGLLNKLKQLGSAKGTVYSSNGGYAEFRQWKPLAQNAEVGRFVGLVYQNKTDNITGGNTFIEVCDGNTDVYGVTVGKSAFCGYQDPAYCLLEPTDNDNSTDTLNCAKVCLLGVVSVRQGASYDGAKVGDYVVSDKYGCAIRSENGVGFRVVGVGQYSGASDSYWNYKYVDIALVPQNDNVARVMAELEGTKQNIGNLSIQIGKLEGDINNSITSIIPDMEEVLEDVNGAISNTQGKLDAAQAALDTAQKISSDAQTAIETAKKEYTEAISDAREAVEDANNSLADLSKIKEDLSVLDEYKDENTSGVVGFVDKVEKDSQTLATLNTRYSEIGNDITLINQKIDENGAAIEHLVAHADKYSVGDYSLTYNLTCEEARGLLGDGEYIYIPTLDHTEESPWYIANLTPEIYADTEYYLNVNNVLYSFIQHENLGSNYILEFNTKTKELKINNKYIGILSSPKEIDTKVVQIGLSPEVSQEFAVGIVYVWNQNWWEFSDLVVSFSTNEPTEDLTDGYLWYTHDGWRENDVWVYNPRTLYCYSKTKKIWVAVARANDGNARTMSFINQTAKEISSTVTNLGGDVSTVKQEVGNISSTVSEIDGDLTRINQTAEAITLGAYSPNKSMSSLEILLNGMRGVSSYSEHVFVGEFSGEPSPSITKYRTAPVWTDNGFSFAEATEATELTIPTYYFDSDKTTYYCKQIDKDIYEIYTIGNQAMANISTRVDENESAITRLTQFETDAGTRLTAVEEKSDANSAQILSIAQMNDVICTKIASELTESETIDFDNVIKYSQPPTWNVNEGKFKFTGESSENGVYCILNDTKKYYKIIDTVSGQGYEQYEVVLSSVKYTTIEQKVNENGASIGMVVENGGVKGGVIAEAINGQSEVTIDANKIAINGTTTFADALNPEQTAISGNYIRTGVLTSNNYSGPITYRMYGAKIIKNFVYSFRSGVGYYTVKGEDGFAWDVHLGVFEYYIGMNLDMDVGRYYYNYNDEWHSINIRAQEQTVDNITDVIYYYDGLEQNVPGDQQIDIYLYATAFKTMIMTSDSLNDCVYYTPIVNGIPSSSVENQTYYYVNNIKAYEELFDTYQDGLSYIISEHYFELASSDIEIKGTKFDLNEGTIYSKNLVLDRYGNLSITGEISATSGWIGDEKGNGFEIKSRTVNGKQEYYLGNNQISYNGLTLPTDVVKGSEGVYIGPDGIGLGNGNFYVDKLGNLYANAEITEDGVARTSVTSLQNGNLMMQSKIVENGKTEYTCNNVSFVDGEFLIDATVYDSEGETPEFAFLQLKDKVLTLKTQNRDESKVSSVELKNGNLTLTGNIVLGGSITWSASSNPVKVLYSTTSGKPTNQDWNNATDNDNSTTTQWHITWNEEYDKYAAYSYDGGMTWNTAIKIKGEDGDSDSGLSEEDVFNMLTDGGYTQGIFPFYTEGNENSVSNAKVFINAEYIKTGTLSGITVKSEASKLNGVTTMGDGVISFQSNNSVKMKLGYVNNDDRDAFIRFGAGTGSGSITIDGVEFVKGTGMLWKYDPDFAIGLIGSDGKNQLMYFRDSDEESCIGFHSDTIIDFDGAEIRNLDVVNLKITFG